MRKLLLLFAAFLAVVVPSAALMQGSTYENMRMRDGDLVSDGAGEFVSEAEKPPRPLKGVYLDWRVDGTGEVSVTLQGVDAGKELVRWTDRFTVSGEGNRTVPVKPDRRAAEYVRVEIDAPGGNASTTIRDVRLVKKETVGDKLLQLEPSVLLVAAFSVFLVMFVFGVTAAYVRRSDAVDAAAYPREGGKR